MTGFQGIIVKNCNNTSFGVFTRKIFFYSIELLRG